MVLIKECEIANTGKVQLPAKVAEAIELVKKMDREMIIRRHSLDEEGTLFEGELAPINELTLSTLIKALYIGYEIELTPKQKAIKYLVDRDIVSRGHSEHDVVASIMNILGVKEHG